MLRPISWFARLRTFLCTFPVCSPLLLFPQRLRRTVLVYFRQALFRFLGLRRLGLPHVVGKMSVPVESVSGLVWCLVRLKGTRNCIYWEMVSRFSRFPHVWSMRQCRRSSAICLIFLREDGPGIDDFQAIWTLLFVPLVRCRTRPIRVLLLQSKCRQDCSHG